MFKCINLAQISGTNNLQMHPWSFCDKQLVDCFIGSIIQCVPIACSVWVFCSALFLLPVVLDIILLILFRLCWLNVYIAYLISVCPLRFQHKKKCTCFHESQHFLSTQASLWLVACCCFSVDAGYWVPYSGSTGHPANSYTDIHPQPLHPDQTLK